MNHVQLFWLEIKVERRKKIATKKSSRRGKKKEKREKENINLDMPG